MIKGNGQRGEYHRLRRELAAYDGINSDLGWRTGQSAVVGGIRSTQGKPSSAVMWTSKEDWHMGMVWMLVTAGAAQLAVNLGESTCIGWDRAGKHYKMSHAACRNHGQILEKHGLVP